MKKMCLFLLCVSISFVLSRLINELGYFDHKYRVQEICTSIDSECILLGISNSGSVLIKYCKKHVRNFKTIIWNMSSTTTVNSPDESELIPRKILKSDVVIGSLHYLDNRIAGFRFVQNKMEYLCSREISLLDIAGCDRQNRIAGTQHAFHGISQAFQTINGKRETIGLSGGKVSSAEAVNDDGMVVGTGQVDAGIMHAFLYNGAITQDLGTLGGDCSYAKDINSTGSVTGVSDMPGGINHAFLYETGVMKDLGVLPGDINSEAASLNDLGQVVGRSCSSGSFNRGFLFSNGRMQDLNKLIPRNLEYVITNAVGINNSGEIVAAAEHNGYSVVVLLSPAMHR